MVFLKNIQFQQLINLLLLIYLSYNNHTLQASLFMVILLMAFSGMLELAIKKTFFIPYSAFITSLGVVLMVGWTRWYIPFIAIFLAIIQKHYLKLDNKHIFNPSNFALIFAVFIFYPKALPIIGEVGKESLIVYLIIIVGALILIRVNRYLITLSFLLAYTILNYIILSHIDTTWSSEHFIASLYSTSFIVYIFFMLTDPITTPNKATLQIAFGFSVAFVIILLDYYFGIRLWHQFIALYLITLLFTIFYRDFNKNDFIKFIITTIISFFIIITICNLKPLYFSM